MRYRIGYSTLKIRSKVEPQATLCLSEAPEELHTTIFHQFNAATWRDACEKFETWRKTHRSTVDEYEKSIVSSLRGIV